MGAGGMVGGVGGCGPGAADGGCGSGGVGGVGGVSRPERRAPERREPERRARIARMLPALAALAALLVVAGLALPQTMIALSLPSWVEWDTSIRFVDADGDGDFEEFRLYDRQVRVYDDGELACTTPVEWKVSDLFVGDVDADGGQDVVCIAWKRGSFGEAMPFWVEEDSEYFSQHVFIFEYRDGELAHKWLSSDIGIEVASASLDSLGRLNLTTRAGEELVCEWQSWGLVYLDEQTPSMHEATTSALTFLAAGDVIPHEAVLAQGQDDGGEGGGEGAGGGDGEGGFSEMLAPIAETVAQADFAAVNVECALVADEGLASGELPVLAAPTSLADALAQIGFDVFEFANNHAADLGQEGLDQTSRYWEEEQPGAVVLGLERWDGEGADAASMLRYVEKDGIRLALLDATDVLNNGNAGASDGQDGWCVSQVGDGSRIIAALEAAEADADLSICFLHFGEEYASEPTDAQEELVKRLIDAGADAVICSHPHVVQRAERVVTGSGNSAYVCYSLGNLLANQPYEQTKVGAMALLTIHKSLVAEGAGGEWSDGGEGAGADEGEDGAGGGAGDADGADGGAYIAGCELIPTICDFDDDGVLRVRLLEDCPLLFRRS